MIRVQVFGSVWIGAGSQAGQAEGVVVRLRENVSVRVGGEGGAAQVVGVVVEGLAARSGGRELVIQ